MKYKKHFKQDLLLTAKIFSIFVWTAYMFNLYVYTFSVIKYSSCWKIIKNVIEFQEILQRKNHQNILMCLTFDKKENRRKNTKSLPCISWEQS